MIWSAFTIGAGVAAAFLLRGFVDGARAGDPEYYRALGAMMFAGAAVLALEQRLRRT